VCAPATAVPARRCVTPRCPFNCLVCNVCWLLLVLRAGAGPHVHDFRLMQSVFAAWVSHTAQQLQGAAALAAMEAAAAYHSSRLAVRAWRAWRLYLAQVEGVCLLGGKGVWGGVLAAFGCARCAAAAGCRLLD
jgi:hypothetical protein